MAPPSKAPLSPQTADPQTIQQKAEAGVGKKGRGYGQGILMTPLSVYFSAQQRVVFSIQIPHALDLFKATENRLPKSHEEFMQKIIKEQDIVLPELPRGHRYVYDPKKGELMVERPAQERPE